MKNVPYPPTNNQFIPVLHKGALVMSLLLGIYSKNSHIDINEFHPVLNDFSLQGKRQTQTEIQERVIFASALNKNGCRSIVKNEAGNLSILFSGNLYDFEENVSLLGRAGHKFENKNCEAEFILHSYEEFGDSFLKNLNGNFSFSIYNRLSNELILANDSFGIWPLFIFDSGKYFIFSSEYQPITQYKNESNRLDLNSIAEFFTLGLPLGNKTFFKNISNLHPGTIMKISPNNSSFKNYHNLSIKIDRNKNIHYFAEALANSINKAVSIRLKNSDNKFFRLTGGADTRLILSNIPYEKRQDIIFQTENSSFLSENDNRDVIIAKIIANRAKLKHSVYSPPPDMNYISDEFGSKFFEKRRALPLTLPFGGWHGSQFLGGICYHMAPIKQKDIHRMMIQMRLRRIFSNEFLRKISNPYSSLKILFNNLEAENKELLFIIHQLTRGFFTNIFKGSRSGWNDPYSFPTRFETVFWDREFLETILTIPKEYLVDYNLYNHLYKNYFPEFIDIPTNSPLAKRSDSCLPRMEEGIEPKAVRRPEYLTALKDYAKSANTWEKGFYNNRFKLEILARVISNKVIHRSHVEDHKLVASFIDFEAWYRNFLGR